MKPTNKQQGWLWEQCGGIHIDYKVEDGCPAHYLMPDRGWIIDGKVIDIYALSFLLKYAVPEIKKRYDVESIVFSWEDDGRSLVTIFYWLHTGNKEIDNYMEGFHAYGDTEEDALFQVAYKALGGEPLDKSE